VMPTSSDLASGASSVGAPRLYIITDRQQTGGRPLAGVIGQALGAVRDGRLPAASVAVQLREKDLGGRELFALAVPLRAVTRAAGVRLFINDRVDVALAVGADGVHLGGGALDMEDVVAIAPDLAIAISAHSTAELERFRGQTRLAFAVLGPIHDTPSKRAYGAPVGVAQLGDACATGIPVVAVGGIDASNAGACIAAGAAGVAVIRAILSDPAPDRALTRIFEAIERT
jgi:thiamine-phosphate pyrophosphorylase